MALIPFDDRDGWIWMDGEFVSWRDAKLHVLTHGLHYASGVFEGERCYAGNIFKLREHTDRLIQSGKLLGFDIPWTADEIDAACIETVRRNGHTDAYVRPIAWRGSEMLAVSAQHTKIHLAIACWGWPNLFGDNRMKGVRLGMAKWRRPAPDTAPTASKAAGLYMIGTLSKHDAEAQGFDDAMMLDYKGDVAEATGANAFFVFDGEVHTPTPVCFLDGITRRTVMRLAQNRQMKVVERTIKAEELGRATEVFLAGTAAEVTPVRAIGEHTYTPGQITETLLGDYEKLVRMGPDEVRRLAA
ncbi:branched-chain amino acid aminotransferase [Roseomonas elaeocarpi]|uniref:Branched-chain-amino-acid aminotransferase n=1 Tax=Roseomonas elaeocarpi TaxID=907779 RepID=A0ABV6JVA2_9PROT